MLFKKNLWEIFQSYLNIHVHWNHIYFYLNMYLVYESCKCIDRKRGEINEFHLGAPLKFTPFYQVVNNPCYSGTYDIVVNILPRYGIEHTFVTTGCPVEEYKKYIKPNTKV